METNNICFATLSTGSKVKLTEELYNQFQEASNDDYLTLPNGTTFKKASVMEIQDIKDWPEENYNYGQIYTDVKELPGIGFSGVFNLMTDTSHVEAFARGLKKAKLRFGNNPTPGIDEFLEKARKRYNEIKSGIIINTVDGKKHYNPKYKTWEEAKEAKVI